MLDAFNQNLYGPASSTASTARSWRAARRRAWCWPVTMRRIRSPISEELAKLLPSAEFIPEWKEGAPLAAAKARMKQFLAKHTPDQA